jgi:hypothetical protein
VGSSPITSTDVVRITTYSLVDGHFLVLIRLPRQMTMFEPLTWSIG